MVLVIAELASKYPFAGSMYQWPTILAGKRVGWWMGWVYACAMFPLMTAYYASLPVLIHPLFNLAPSFTTDAIIIVIAAVIAVLWNILRIGVLGRIAQWAMVLELSVVTVVCLLTFILGGEALRQPDPDRDRDHDVVRGRRRAGAALAGTRPPALPRRRACSTPCGCCTRSRTAARSARRRWTPGATPRAGSSARTCSRSPAGFLFLLTPHAVDPGHEGGDAGRRAGRERHHRAPARRRVQALPGRRVHRPDRGHEHHVHRRGPAHLRHGQGRAAAVLPTFSRTLKDGSPWTAVLLIGVLSLVPVFVFTTKTSSIVGGATAAMYVAYFLVMTVTLIYRLRGWPKVKGWFSLGRWGIPVNIVAVIGTGLTASDLLWPRAGHQPDLQPDRRAPAAASSSRTSRWPG